MKKVLGSTIVAVLLCLCLLPATAMAEDAHEHSYTNGFCECGAYEPAVLKDGVYQIGNAGQLYWFAGLVNGTLTDGTTKNPAANAVLTDNITVNTGVLTADGALASDTSTFKVWTPIGDTSYEALDTDSSVDASNAYEGTFDGQNHIISGLYLNNAEGKNDCALFGMTTDGAQISNLTVADSYFGGRNRVAGVCARNNGSITNCTNRGAVSSSKKTSGGICGWNQSGTITGCTNSGTVTGSQYTGGVCGFNDGRITGCVNSGTVTGSQYTGGVCGYNRGTISTNCTNSGAVTGTNYTGGVCGYNVASGKIEDCRNEGTVGGKYYTGGVSGYNIGSITGCTNSGSVTGTKSTTDTNYGTTGGVCGYNSGTITGCTNYGTVTGTSNTGGVCGYNANNKTITGCTNYGTVTGTRDTGGVCGYNDGTIDGCVNSGDVSGTNIYTGGVSGDCNGTIKNSLNTGSVSGTSEVGGVCGYLGYYSSITYCANFGTVTGTVENIGGVCGQNYNGTITNCYFNSDAYSGKAVGKNGGTTTDVTGKTPAQFASGEVAWLLNGSTSESDLAWGQAIGTDLYPVLGGATVYQTTGCVTYSNTSGTKEHTDVGGICADCGEILETISDPYVIGSQDALNAFVKAVNSGNVSINATLTVDGLTLTTPIGQNADSKRYTGTFDGQNHTLTVTLSGGAYTAPFAAIENATVKNLTVTGSITCTVGISGVGGAVGFSYGSSNITGVISHVAITDTGVVLHHVGGVVGSAQTGTTVEKCMYDGTINLTATTDCIGGIVGYANQNTSIQNSANLGSVHSSASDAYVGGILGYVNNAAFKGITNCYNVGSVTCSSGTYCGAIVGWVNSKTQPSTITNNYYLTTSCANAFGTGGKSGTATSATAEEFASGEVAWLLNGSASEGVWGQTIGTDLYPVLGGETVYQTTPCGAAYSNTSGAKEHDYVNGLCADCGAVEENVNISDPDYVYQIDSQKALNAFVAAVNSGNVSINAQLSVNGLTLTTPIGRDADGKRYTGVFDGGNHTLTVTLSGGDNTAPFAAIENATIKNLRTTGTIQTGGKYAAGLVSNAWHTVTIENCYSDVIITSTVNGDGTHGGLVGRSNPDAAGAAGVADITIRNCGFAGQINGENTNACGGLMGWIHQGQTLTVKNCYVAGTFTVAGSSSDTICRNIENVSATVTNFYYLTKLGGFGGGKPTLQANCRQLTAAQFASGEAAWLLRGGEEDNGSVWGQTIGTDAYPVPGGATVYRLNALRCDGQVLDTYVFSNSTAAPIPDHTFSGNTCTVCGYSMPIIPVIPTYPPTVTQPAEGGTVTVSPQAPAQGVTVTITPRPEDGYEVGSISVTDRIGNPVAVTDNGDGTYSFTQPAGAVTVSVTFTDKTQLAFTDVSVDAYYYDAVLWAVKKGITDGTGDGTTFSPDAPCTRGQIVTFLWRAAGCPEPESLSSLSDVPADAYYAKAVAWAVENGITDGVGDNTFAPDATCTRDQAVTFLWRAAGQPSAADGTAFADVSADAYYAPAVQWAAENAVTNGTGDGSIFDPGAICTRGQIVTFLYRWLVK